MVPSGQEAVPELENEGEATTKTETKDTTNTVGQEEHNGESGVKRGVKEHATHGWRRDDETNGRIRGTKQYPTNGTSVMQQQRDRQNGRQVAVRDETCDR